ncbi:MAG: DMT family transporter [Pseudomonadota bacterium]
MSLNPMSPTTDTNVPLAAALIALMSFVFFSVLDASAKWLVIGGQAVIFVVWVRFTAQAIMLTVYYRGWSNARLWRMENPLLQFVRGLLLPLMTLLNFTALQYLQLAETIAVLLATPLLVAVLARPFLDERVGRQHWLAIILGFFGVLLVVKPGTAAFAWPTLFIIGSMVAYALYFLLTRKLAPSETPESLIFYSCIFATVLFAPFALVEAQMPARTSDWIAFGFACVAGMLGHMGIIKASSLANASDIAPFGYTQVMWMTGIGFFIFGDVPGGLTLMGMLVIAASGLYLMWLQRQRRTHS